MHPYTVQRGDCLSRIAQNHGMTTDQLLRYNPQFSANPDFIRPGDRVYFK